MRSPVVRWLLILGGLLLTVTPILSAENGNVGPAVTQEATLQKLIAELGSPEFLSRERAQAQLLEMGLEAFEAVFAAQTHRDVEIATRARYIVRGMNVRWFADDDAPEIKRTLRDYGDLRPEDRQARIDRLQGLELPLIAPVLCRIARFEPDTLVSKYAALKLMDKTAPTEQERLREIAKVIRTTVAEGKRPAAIWLREYAKTLEEPVATLPIWQQLVKEELALRTEFPERTRATLCRDLLRWHIKLLLEHQQTEAAESQIGQLVALVDGSREQVTELVTWLVTRESWKHITSLYDRHTTVFDEFPFLMYQYALAQLRLGNQAAADATAEKALNSRPNNPEEHYAAAYNLKETGLFDWAEKEFRKLIKETTIGSRVDVMSRLVLSEMLHDQVRELAAAETLQGLADAMDKDETVKQSVERMRDDAEGVYARMFYFYSEHSREQKDFKKQIELLDKAIARDARDADVLIALYRLPNQDKARQTKTRELIEEATQEFRTEIDNFRKELEKPTDEIRETMTERQLAISCNQFAWLVGNTIGDYDEAIRYSHRSLEIKKNEAGYLDTLGRCYYAKRDLANALKYQREAVRLDPHAGAIRRQLALFEKEAAAAGKQDSPPQGSR